MARFIAARRAGRKWFAARRRQLPAWRLDAAERAAEFVDLALVSDFLALGNLDEFQHFVEHVNHVLQRLGNFGGMRDGLADGRGFCRTKIGGFDPWLRAWRFRTVIGTPLAGKFAGRPGFLRRRNLGGRIGRRSFQRLGFMRGKIGGRFSVRFAEIAGSISFVFRVLSMFRA